MFVHIGHDIIYVVPYVCGEREQKFNTIGMFLSLVRLPERDSRCIECIIFTNFKVFLKVFFIFLCAFNSTMSLL